MDGAEVYLSWRGQEVRILDEGHGEPLLLIAGIGCSADMWAPFWAQVTHRRVVSFDAPGTGRSSIPLYPISIESLAALTAAVLDARGIESTDVIGFSYGGAVAQQFAYDYPSRVQRLVLAATTCGIGSTPGSIEALAALASPLRFYSPSYFERVAATVYGGVTGRDPARRLRDLETRRRLPPSTYGYTMQLLGAVGWSSRPFLPNIPHETLVISGDDDPLIPTANAELLARHIPRARLDIVADAGHLFLWDDAEQANARIAPFLA